MIQNMRDLGGIRTIYGRQIRSGMLIRSANLFQAEEQDLEGVYTIIDLRTPGERKEAPDQTCGRQYLPLPVFDDITAGISHENGSMEQRLPDMAYLYGRMMRECTVSISGILRTIMRHDFEKGAILWHCSEGKDRCGMVSALILEALGVDRNLIMEDYLKTNLVNLPKAVSIHGQLLAIRGKEYADSVYQAYIADERYLQAAWDAMGTDYILEKLHMDDSLLQSFRDTVLIK